MKKWLLCLIIITIYSFSYAQVRHLTVEPNHSTIGFEVLIAGGATKVTGKFMDFDLQLQYVDNDWTKSLATFTIETKSINTGIDGRDEHLRSADFFHVDTFPKITFISVRIEKKDDQKFIAYGNFTMHGITKEMAIPFEVTYEEGNTIGIQIETIVNRIDHMIGHEFVHTAMDNFLSEDIPVKINFWTKKDKRKKD